MKKEKLNLKESSQKDKFNGILNPTISMEQLRQKLERAFFLEFSHLDGDCFQIFLDEFAKKYPDNLNVIQLDNGRFYYNSKLKIPDHVILIFQPPYTPELNPIERLWQDLKKQLSWSNFQNLSSLKEKVSSILEEFFTGKNYFFSRLGLHFRSFSYCCMIF